ncbi:VOC family protein [Paenibacillus sp. CAU 1782]
MNAKIKLDHFVIHIDEDKERLALLKQDAERLGFPYRPERGKGTSSFKVSNMWIGDHYFELVCLRKPQTDWRKEWEALYNEGKRGVFGLMLMTDNLQAVREEWLANGIQASQPERISFKLFGLIQISMPWQTVYAPPIPGTNLTIAVSQMDSERQYQQIRTRRMKPNSEENGITGIAETIVRSDFSPEALRYIEQLFPGRKAGSRERTISLDDSTLRFEHVASVKQELQVDLNATCNAASPNKGSFTIANVRVSL